MKIRLLLLALAFCVGGMLNAQIYVHNFEGTPYSTPYTAAPNTLAANLSASSWTTSPTVFTNFGGATGQALSLNNSGGTPTYTLTFNVDAGYQLSVNSFSFWRVRSGTGAQNWSMTINGISVGSGTVPTTGAGTGTLTVSNAVSNLTGTVTVVLSLSGASGTGTFRLDDFTLNGSVNLAGPYTITNGDWNVGATWNTGMVPTNTDNVTLTAPYVVYTTVPLQRDAVTMVNGTFELRDGGFAQGTNFTYGSAGGLNFNTTGVYNVNNTHVYWPAASGPFNVSVLQGGMQMNSTSRTVAGTFVSGGNLGVAFATPSALTLNGICRIDPSGYFLNSPIFGNASELIYNTGGTFGRGFEWLFNGVGTIGTSAGYPNNVTLSASTTLNYNNGTPAAKALNGNLTIDAGSHFDMNQGTSSALPLTVAGNVINNGTITLGNVNAADLKLFGDFTNTGIFNGNARAVYFSKATGTQTVSSTTGLTFPYVVFDSTGSRTVQLNNGLTISAPNAGNAIAFNSAADVFSLNNQSLTIGTVGVANTITGNGMFNGTTSTTTTSSMTLIGTGSIGTLNFVTGSQNLASLSISRTTGTAAATLGTALRVQSALTLNGGYFDVGNNVLTLGPSIAYSGSASNYIIADKSNAAAEVRKIFSAAGNFTFPIGDAVASLNGSQYSPCAIILAGGSYSATSYVSVGVNDIQHPNFESAADFITRYWQVGTSGITAPTTFTASGTYLPADVNTPANEATYKRQRWDGTAWTAGTVVAASATGPVNCVVASTNHITAGLRDVDINVRGVIAANPTITSGDVTPSGLDNTLFAAQTLGNSLAKTFRIENIGDGNLSVPTITLTGVNPGDFSITASTPYSIAGPTGFVDFTVTFQPTASGVRTAIVNIANNDSSGSENPYTFMVQGTGDCPTNTNTVTPASGPAGTVVTITANTGNLNGASVTFNGVAAVVTQISATQVTVVVPVGAVSGPVITTNAAGCSVSTTFGIIKQVTGGCQGGAALPSSLFISQVTDSGADAMSYIEIYNGTGAAVNLNGWSLQFFNNGSATQNGGNVALNNVMLPNNSMYTVVVGTSSPACSGFTGGNGELGNQSSGIGGVNFNNTNNNNGHDHIRLYNGATHVDSWGVYTDQTWAVSLNLNGKGANFERKNNVVAPNTTYTNADWNITDWGDTCTDLDYSNVGSFDFLAGTPPTVTVQPVFTPSCKQTSFTVTATEGFVGGNALAYQWYEVAPGATTWTALANVGVYSGVSTATLTISNIAGLTGYQYYVQVRENTATCYTASNAVMITGVTTVTWNGTAWTPSAPTATTPAVIDGNYNTAANGSFEACSLTVNGTRTLVISPNTYVSIVNDLTVAAGGTLQVQDDGSLVMIEDSGVVTNNGTTQVARTTTPFVKYDYTYWSSPVFNTTLGAAMPGWRFDYSWTFNTANYTDVTGPNGTGPADGFDDNNDTWTLAGSGATMIPAKGYTVMTPTNLPAYPTTTTVTFSGRVNNGIINIPLSLSANPADTGDDYNLVGNPYPSSIFADDFINLNTNTSGTLLFWTHSTPVSNTAPGPYQNNFVTSDYAMYNLSGGVASSNGGAQPTGYVASGQGFFIEAITGTNLVFNNSMRDKTYGNANFYRNSNMAVPAPQKDRVWLNLQHAIGLFSQQLICYSDAATLDIDRGYDAVVSNAGNSVSFYSFIAGDKYRIQGRPAFWTSDIVPLGLKTALPGSYTISIEHAEGILNDPSTPIYLEDKLLNVIHDLKQGPYVFDIPLGASDDRFQLRYTDSALGNPVHENPEQNVLVVSSGNDVLIKSGVENLATVEIFDMVGRLVYSKKDINATEITIPVYVQEQALLVRIELTDGSRTAKKIVH
ncbi:choice-of-anchor D domain-containing protein [Flavobacterium sp. MAH-1]|uniref:Choice-of-anchor D domain-containing protein n=1 Tax=Flavobacterium agri TaxID=2743471 RepID=A0A7Y8Y0S4_9FLAO|nr:choice-of-anchor D domain-containing protein [Flavobacterium agri]NUY80337.1 choice-of-anchor D domain-containing protein [Flavobacterium agri]NYA70362.1 choice-of-anchor D domain-containing protein [Flavobacterium agri]